MARRADWVLPHGSFLAEAGRERGGKTGAVLAASLSALMKALKKKQPRFHIVFAHLSLTTCLKPMFD